MQNMVVIGTVVKVVQFSSMNMNKLEDLFSYIIIIVQFLFTLRNRTLL